MQVDARSDARPNATANATLVSISAIPIRSLTYAVLAGTHDPALTGLTQLAHFLCHCVVQRDELRSDFDRLGLRIILQWRLKCISAQYEARY